MRGLNYLEFGIYTTNPSDFDRDWNSLFFVVYPIDMYMQIMESDELGFN